MENKIILVHAIVVSEFDSLYFNGEYQSEI